MKYQQSFSLIAALFVLTVLTVVVGFTISIAGMSRNTAGFSMQGVKAYFAARSGLEWGLYQVTNNPTACPANATLSLTQGGLQDFSVQVTCSAVAFVEGTGNINVFALTSIASKGAFGMPDYVSREMQISVALPY